MSQRLRNPAPLRRALRYAGLAASALGWDGDRPRGGPLYAHLSICDPCDHRCVWCQYHPPSAKTAPRSQFGDRPPGIMSLATFEGLIDELAALGTTQVDLVGRGEPLLHPHALDMVRLAKARGFTVTMISNGTRLDGAHARALVQAGLDRFQVSLDAATESAYRQVHVSEDVGAFTSVKERLAGLAAERRRQGAASPRIWLSFTLGAVNVEELPAMVDTVAEVGADGAHFHHCLPMTPDAKPTLLTRAQLAELLATGIPAAEARAAALGIETNLRELRASPPTYLLEGDPDGPRVVPCYIGSVFTVVLGNGVVMPCCQTERGVGSLEEERFTGIWRGPRYAAFRRAARQLPAPSPDLETAECGRCYFRPHNIAIHELLHPWARLHRLERFSLRHLLRISQLLR